ncbi:MAG: DNA polymerase ligase N-terminal domain-containing protein [Acidimicrobiales bacterium]
MVNPDNPALDRYRRKRDFAATPEPAPDDGTPPNHEDHDREPRFVVQEHHARALHWDFRLERDGVLVSWAVPKGVPPDPKVNHLAVPTEDHPLSYIDFEGDIPAGNYGGGHVSVWDHGTYECEKWGPSEVMVVLHGQRVEGRYVLFRTGTTGGGQPSGSRPGAWMIHRMDPPQDPDRRPLPGAVEPMVATPGSLPADDDEGWAYEVRWTGQRVLAWSDGGRVALRDTQGQEMTATWPEVRGLGPALGARQVVLDGMVAVLDAGGVPDAAAVRRRLSLDKPKPTPATSATYLAFDLVHLDGHDLTDQPYERRRQRLAELELAGPAWAVPAHHVGDGAAFAGVIRARNLSGVVAKRLDSPYHPGPSPHWVEVRATT